MTEIGITTLLLIIANVFCSVQGLNDHAFFERFNIEIDKIIVKKDYKRLLTSGFFHVSWLHLIVNIASLCFFSGGIESHLGAGVYLLIYFLSLLGGNLFILFIHRGHPDFCAAGTSGAVTGIIFATIALFPGFQIGLLGFHLPVPGWFYGLLYVLFSIYGIKSKKDNIGHETQLAGGFTGLLIAVLMKPGLLENNYLAVLSMAVASIFFIYIIVTKPWFILIDNKFFNQHRRHYSIENISRRDDIDHQQEIDLILEKIHQNGIGSLTKAEKEKLDYYSKIIQ